MAVPIFNRKFDEADSISDSTPTIMASVSNFKTAVIRIRDILRSPGVSVTGMDSMRHICLYLMSRYMTRAKVVELGVPLEFAWETLIEDARTKNGGLQNALDCFYHREVDCLVNHFDRLFGTDKFAFDVKSLQKHKEIMEILDEVNMANVDCQMDILGWVYEQHLKTGSSAARDLGQFFTDRFICEYMTALCKPGFKSEGVPESVCDPAMGTGGFLAAYIKYFKKHHVDKPVNWAVQQKEIYGCDTDPKVAGVARLNLFMETGGNRMTNLLTRDSLYSDLVQTGYDVILANEPFGLKGLTHAECCERVKALKIRGTKSEPLFLQLMMASLNIGGRCAVVVPDGMLVNSSSCHNGTRKHLLDHFELRRVVKMKGQFFMNTGIQPSILFFENTGKPTTAVEFWEVVRGDKGDITETMVVSVPREKIDATASLDMRRYLEVKVVANPCGYPVVKLGDVCDLLSGKTNNERGVGDIPFYDSNGQIAIVNKHLFDGDFIITARVLSIGSVHLVSGKFWAGDNTINMRIKIEHTTNIRYLFYWLKLNATKFQDIKSGIIPKIRKSDVANLQMPLPPRPIQDEIVATLDRIYTPGTTELAETLKMTNKAMDLVLANPGGITLEPIVEAQRLIRKAGQMAADVKGQMAAIVRSVGNRGFEMKKLSDVCTILGGKANKERDTKLTVPYYDSNGIIGYVANPLFSGEYIITARKLSIGAVHYVNGPFYPSDNTINFTTSDASILNNRFFYYWLLLNNKVLKDLSSGIKPGIRKSDVAEIKMPVPPIDFQLSVLSRIESLQTQLTALESLQKQSEDNARFILESYLNSASTAAESPSPMPLTDAKINIENEDC